MALAKKCDICGRFYETYNSKNNQLKPSGIMFVNVCVDDTFYSGDVTDCCPKCMAAIMNAVDSLMPAAPEMREDEPMEE